jgi:CO dehydrogenase maturation factor
MSGSHDKHHIEHLTEELECWKGSGKGMRVFVAGKGGVGKTTLAAALCLLQAKSGRVLAVDQDSQQNLAFALGYPPQLATALTPITEDRDYVEEKTGSRPGTFGGLMRLNPDVSDMADRFGVHIAPNLDLLVMGGVARASSGCLCAENALLGSMVRYLECMDGDLILMDTQAGLEPFGRAVAEGFACALVVTDLTSNSLQVAERAGRLSRELGIQQVGLVVNRHEARWERKLDDITASGIFDSVHRLPFDPSIYEHDPDIGPVIDAGGPYAQAVAGLLAAIREDR